MKRGNFLSGMHVTPFHNIVATVRIISQKTTKDRKMETPGTMLQIRRGGPYIPQLCGKRASGIGLSASLLLELHMKVTLTMITVRINGIRNLTLLDMGCSRSLEK